MAFAPLGRSNGVLSGIQNVNFSSAVNDWVRQTEARMREVFQGSVQELADTARENTPVDTGELRGSLRAALTAMPQFVMPSPHNQNPSQAGVFSGQSVESVVKEAKIGDTVFLGYTAPYSIFVEYGTYKMAPRAFVRRAAEQWQVIVNNQTQRAMSGGRVALAAE